MSARPVVMWAAVLKTRRGMEWMFEPAIRRTRRESKAAYLEVYEPEHHKRLLKGVRFARVTVSEGSPDERK